jgi:hypothetical protein
MRQLIFPGLPGQIWHLLPKTRGRLPGLHRAGPSTPLDEFFALNRLRQRRQVPGKSLSTTDHARWS